MTEICFKKIREEARAPTRATDGSAGWDLYAVSGYTIAPHQTLPIATGLSIAIPSGHVGLICSRSGLAMRGVLVTNGPGILDSDYRGEVKVLLSNIGGSERIIAAGDRVAQLVVAPVITCLKWLEVEELDDTERAEGGFGSSGR